VGAHPKITAHEGVPMIKNVPVGTIVRLAAAGRSAQEIAAIENELVPEDIPAALLFAADLLEEAATNRSATTLVQAFHVHRIDRGPPEGMDGELWREHLERARARDAQLEARICFRADD
jgi:uncharacterized protein (DUF433 family)